MYLLMYLPEVFLAFLALMEVARQPFWVQFWVYYGQIVAASTGWAAFSSRMQDDA